MSNIKPALLKHFAKLYGREVSAEDMMAYIAAVMANPAFTARFAPDLVQPGLRVPLTAEAALFNEAVALGREVVWLHCYGERFADPKADRPKQAPRMPKEIAPRIPKDGAIPLAPEPLPETMDYDPAKRRLTIGEGYIDNVSQQMWDYEVSGKKVLRQWFSYRRRDRTPPVYRANPDDVRAELHMLLAQVRAAKSLPWEPKRAACYRVVFPQMANWLPDIEAKQLRFEFEAELVRLKAA